jgi:hypothetical protein
MKSKLILLIALLIEFSFLINAQGRLEIPNEINMDRKKIKMSKIKVINITSHDFNYGVLDEEGRDICTKHFDSNGLIQELVDGSNIYKYFYDSKGNVIKSILYEGDNESNIENYMYNSFGGLSVKYYFQDTITEQPSMINHITYGSNKLIKEKVDSSFTDDRYIITGHHTYDYNKQAKLIEQIDSTFEKGECYVDRTLFEYDKAERLCKKTYYYEEGKMVTRSIYHYDSKGLLIERIGYGGGETEKIIMNERETFNYNENGNVVEEKEYNSLGRIQMKTIYSYDNYSNLLSETKYSPLGKIKNVIKYHYEYYR